MTAGHVKIILPAPNGEGAAETRMRFDTDVLAPQSMSFEYNQPDGPARRITVTIDLDEVEPEEVTDAEDADADADAAG